MYKGELCSLFLNPLLDMLFFLSSVYAINGNFKTDNLSLGWLYKRYIKGKLVQKPKAPTESIPVPLSTKP